jgi:hypothetical protein
MQTKVIADTLAKLETYVISYNDVEPTLWTNQKFVLALVKQQNGFALEWTEVSLKKDRKFMLAVAELDLYLALKYADASLKKDKAFVLEAAELNWRATLNGNVKNNLIKTKKFMLEMARINLNAALEYADDSLQEDREFWRAVQKIINSQGTLQSATCRIIPFKQGI